VGRAPTRLLSNSRPVDALQRPLRGVLRLAGGVALVTAAAFAAVNLGPVMKDRVVRRETVRRVKAKVRGRAAQR